MRFYAFFLLHSVLCLGSQIDTHKFPIDIIEGNIAAVNAVKIEFQEKSSTDTMHMNKLHAALLGLETQFLYKLNLVAFAGEEVRTSRIQEGLNSTQDIACANNYSHNIVISKNIANAEFKFCIARVRESLTAATDFLTVGGNKVRNEIMGAENRLKDCKRVFSRSFDRQAYVNCTHIVKDWVVNATGRYNVSLRTVYFKDAILKLGECVDNSLYQVSTDLNANYKDTRECLLLSKNPKTQAVLKEYLNTPSAVDLQPLYIKARIEETINNLSTDVDQALIRLSLLKAAYEDVLRARYRDSTDESIYIQLRDDVYLYRSALLQAQNDLQFFEDLPLRYKVQKCLEFGRNSYLNSVINSGIPITVNCTNWPSIVQLTQPISNTRNNFTARELNEGLVSLITNLTNPQNLLNKSSQAFCYAGIADLIFGNYVRVLNKHLDDYFKQVYQLKNRIEGCYNRTAIQILPEIKK